MTLRSKQELLAYFYVVVHEAAGIRKVGVLGVDVCQLDGDQVVNLERNSVEMSEVKAQVKILRQALVRAGSDHVVGDGKSFSEQRGDHFYDGIVQLWKPQQLLQTHRAIGIRRSPADSAISLNTNLLCFGVFLTCVL